MVENIYQTILFMLAECWLGVKNIFINIRGASMKYSQIFIGDFFIQCVLTKLASNEILQPRSEYIQYGKYLRKQFETLQIMVAMLTRWQVRWGGAGVFSLNLVM